jgi:hypothetical protein
MIQRLQSLLLLAATVCNAILLFFPVLIYGTRGFTQYPPLSGPDGAVIVHDIVMIGTLGWSIIIVFIAIILLSIACIFRYKNRVSQARLCFLIAMLQVLSIGLTVFLQSIISEFYSDTFVRPVWGIALMVLAFVLFLLSRRFILKDEALVRSADRLR